MKGSKAAQVSVKKGIKVAGVWYRAEAYPNEGPDSRSELCCGWGHIENKYINKPTCGYCSGHHRTCDHKCNVVGCMAKQGSLCGHTLEKCPNWKGKHIAFSNRCTKKAEATRAARPSRNIGQRASTNAAADEASGKYRVVLRPQPKGAAEEEGVGGSAAEMKDVRETEATGEAEDVNVTETANTTAIETEIGAETEMGALATNDQSDPAQLH